MEIAASHHHLCQLKFDDKVALLQGKICLEKENVNNDLSIYPVTKVIFPLSSNFIQ